MQVSCSSSSMRSFPFILNFCMSQDTQKRPFNKLDSISDSLSFYNHFYQLVELHCWNSNKLTIPRLNNGCPGKSKCLKFYLNIWRLLSVSTKKEKLNTFKQDSVSSYIKSILKNNPLKNMLLTTKLFKNLKAKWDSMTFFQD